MADPAAEDPMQRWFESVWTEREETVYRAQFGDLGPGVFRAAPRHFERFKQPAAHEGWLHHVVFACPPHGDRAHWLHVTSGLSNPWNLREPGRDATGSGLGFELCLFTPARADWAIEVLHHLMAWQLLVATGAVQGQPLAAGQRVPLGGPIDGRPGSALTWALVEPVDTMAPTFDLPSGRVEWLQLVGVSEAEVRFARARSQQELVARLRVEGHWPCTDAARPSLRGLI